MVEFTHINYRYYLVKFNTQVFTISRSKNDGTIPKM